MTVATIELAQSFGLSESELLTQALRSFLHEKRRRVLEARLELLARYQVQTLKELETRIHNSELPEHPTWEDLIVVENLTARLEELDGYLRHL
jgi:hypothetical protein